MDPAPLIFLAVLAGIFWFLIIRPQRQRQTAHRSMVADLGPGDEVITAGGVFGRIESIADDHIVLEIAPGTRIRLAKDAVATIVPKDEPTAAIEEDDG